MSPITQRILFVFVVILTTPVSAEQHGKAAKESPKAELECSLEKFETEKQWSVPLKPFEWDALSITDEIIRKIPRPGLNARAEFDDIDYFLSGADLHSIVKKQRQEMDETSPFAFMKPREGGLRKTVSDYENACRRTFPLEEKTFSQRIVGFQFEIEKVTLSGSDFKNAFVEPLQAFIEKERLPVSWDLRKKKDELRMLESQKERQIRELQEKSRTGKVQLDLEEFEALVNEVNTLGARGREIEGRISQLDFAKNLIESAWIWGEFARTVEKKHPKLIARTSLAEWVNDSEVVAKLATFFSENPKLSRWIQDLADCVQLNQALSDEIKEVMDSYRRFQIELEGTAEAHQKFVDLLDAKPTLPLGYAIGVVREGPGKWTAQTLIPIIGTPKNEKRGLVVHAFRVEPDMDRKALERAATDSFASEFSNPKAFYGDRNLFCRHRP